MFFKWMQCSVCVFTIRCILSSIQRGKDESDGTSIGVVVVVGLAAAIVFFVLGILASRYWSGRRERTFNVLEVGYVRVDSLRLSLA